MTRPKAPRRPSAPHRSSLSQQNSYHYSRDASEVTPLVRRKSEHENHLAWRRTKIAGAAFGALFMVLIALGIVIFGQKWWERDVPLGDDGSGKSGLGRSSLADKNYEEGVEAFVGSLASRGLTELRDVIAMVRRTEDGGGSRK
ncbi:hypothetical protein B0O99DRAFT_630972 [Bisporella sp. PMI_857]|nr:hypothetical protein B0O99DRAFT_630972 [Bisporella sp. PMI_857]